jgi:pimeloyl-ACP methyl ester carboxylesterase
VHVRTADGVLLDGALYTPPSPQPAAVAVLVVHGVFGNYGDPVLAFLGRGLAAAGYPVLALNLRSHDEHYATSLFPDTARDIRAGIDYLASQGAQQIYLAAHSLGTLSVPYYVATTGDCRVAGLGLYAPLDDLPTVQRDYLSGREAYSRLVTAAQALVAQGDGRDEIPVPVGPNADVRLLSADTFLSWRGPDAQTVPIRWLPQIDRPLLIVYGEDDWITGPERRRPFREPAEALYDAATAAAARDVREAPGEHSFIGGEAAVVRLTVDWLKSHIGLAGPCGGGAAAPG